MCNVTRDIDDGSDQYCSSSFESIVQDVEREQLVDFLNLMPAIQCAVGCIALNWRMGRFTTCVFQILMRRPFRQAVS